MFTALLDTNVLWSGFQRDFLLTLACEGFYRPLWSTEILEELYAGEVERLEVHHNHAPSSAEESAENLVGKMKDFFGDGLVSGWEPLVGSFGLPDPNDEHVLAAAVIGSAGAIVTSNLKHFPRDLVPPSIDLVDPAEFAANTVELNPSHAANCLVQISARYKNPRRTVQDLSEHLSSTYKMGDAAALLSPHLPNA